MILGITGAFGCGKSTLLAMLEKRGFAVLGADAVCHELYAARDPELFAGIEERFGRTVFTPDGGLDRRALAGIVFADRAALTDLDAIVHPAVERRLAAAVAEARRDRHDLAVEAALLFEIGFEKQCDRTICVYCAPEIRRLRLEGRGFTAAEMARRDTCQMPAAAKLELADYGVINNGSGLLLEEQLNEIMEKLKPYRDL